LPKSVVSTGAVCCPKRLRPSGDAARHASAGLSYQAKKQHPRRFDNRLVDQGLRDVAMRCYSHLSDDDREQTGLAKALGHSIGAIAQAIGLARTVILPADTKSIKDIGTIFSRRCWSHPLW